MAGKASAADPPQAKSGLKQESFDHDPHWDGWNNQIVPSKPRIATQDFGYSASAFSTDHKGELGGTVQRSATPAYFAMRMPTRTLDDPFTASGTFALTRSSASSGVFFGLFNSDQPVGGGRPVNSIGLDFDGEKAGARLSVRMNNSVNKACGIFITPFVPGKYRPTPIRNDGTRYTWKLSYDPAANHGDGQFNFIINSNSNQPEKFEGKSFVVDLPPGFKKENATFDRFGMLDGTKTGGVMSIYFGNPMLDGKPLDPSKDSEWVGQNNRGQLHESVVAGQHHFGYSETTNFAGGAPGEVGGDLWRAGKYAYYADKVDPLSLDHPLHAAGRVILKVGAPDSDMFIGFFDGSIKDNTPAAVGSFLGVHVGGPTRIGHYFAPACATSKGTIGRVKAAPILTPGKPLHWSLDYDPAADDGRGSILVKLADESVTLNLSPQARSEGAHFDHFGLLTSNIGGQLVRVYFDDLEYTAK
jgi:hypothetical protein